MRNRKGFSLLELLIALSILLILTGAAFLYLGDILFKAKVAKARNDLEVIVSAVVLHDAEEPSDKLDTGLIGSKATTPDPNNLPFQTINSLVGTYLLSTPVDPWGGFYVANSYAGYIKSLASDYKISGTSKYDKDIVSYYLPENLFLVKSRAEDINGSGILDTGDQVTLYFSKAVRAVHTNATVAAHAAYAADAASFRQYGVALAAPVAGAPVGGSSFTAQDLTAFQPGSTVPNLVHSHWDLTGADMANANLFRTADDPTFRAAKFADRLLFTYGRTSVARGTTQGNLDIGSEIYIRTYPMPTASQANEADHESLYATNYSRAYAIWESTIGYTAYKTVAEKNLMYLKYPVAADSKDQLADTLRTLTWKTIID